MKIFEGLIYRVGIAIGILLICRFLSEYLWIPNRYLFLLGSGIYVIIASLLCIVGTKK